VFADRLRLAGSGTRLLGQWRRAGFRPAARDLVKTTIAAATVAIIGGWMSVPAHADDYGRLVVIEENDGLLPDGRDRHYTQGAMLAYLSPSLKPDDFAQTLFTDLGQSLPFFQPGLGVTRKFDVVVGQSIFTPQHYHDPVPDPRDRPFAGWLYTGGSILQDTNGVMLENLELLAGVVGPDALAKEAQETFHSIGGFNNQNLDQGYRYQLKNEPGFMLTYERKWRFWQANLGPIQAEFIPEAGLTGGNVMTYAAAGGTFRFGQNLNVDYGIPRVRPALSGTNWFDASRLTQDFGWYLFAGVEGRAVAHNIFLDGNTVANSRSVDKKILVGDFSTGASVFWRDWVKFDVSFTERTKEFTTQHQADHFGNANLAIRF
jgi:lipid A 3-O-deacylase